jgi:zinc D-Ala-D-Ala carboxypeptidase
LGTTIDFGTPSIKGDFSKFGGTKEFEWLVNNAHKFGFILSYPKDNEYYIYEPWHWRYVGVALATRLHDEEKYFYGFSQRIIDSYLVNIFD